MPKASAYTSKTQVGQPSINTIPQKPDLSTGNEKNLNQAPALRFENYNTPINLSRGRPMGDPTDTIFLVGEDIILPCFKF